MSADEPTIPPADPPFGPVPAMREPPPARASSETGVLPPSLTSPSDGAVATSMGPPRPRIRRVLSNRRGRWIAAVVLACSVIGVSVGLATFSSATPPSPAAAAGHAASGTGAAGGPPLGGGGSNARSGPASGGASGTVGNVAVTSFTMTTSAGQDVTVDETSSTAYDNRGSSTTASAVTKGETVLVLGTTENTTIKATQVIVQPVGGSATSTAAKVVPFQRSTDHIEAGRSDPGQLQRRVGDYRQRSDSEQGDGSCARHLSGWSCRPSGEVDRR